MTAQVPALEPLAELRLPESVERVLPGGLTGIAVRRPGVPLVEVRLRVPFTHADLPTASVLSQTLLAGTDRMSNVQIAAELQAVGGSLSAGVDPDRLSVYGNALAPDLDRLLEILAQVLTGAAYPAGEVATERDRLADRIQVARSQPAHLVRVALQRRVYGDHPYAVQTPEPEEVRAVGTGALRALHEARVRPAGATLVLVGDVDPDAALDRAGKALAGWDGGAGDAALPPAPPLATGPLVLVDRPELVQSSIRVALPAVGRTHPDHPALQLANLIFGGYMSSRWTENLREVKGYTYSCHSGVEHQVAGSLLVASAEVATEVTGPALLETWYELGRLATGAAAPTVEELAQARQYALGSIQFGLATQASIAGLVATYAGFGLRLDHVARYARALGDATVDDVAAAAARYLAPGRAAVVVLGEAAAVEPGLAALGPVTTARA